MIKYLLFALISCFSNVYANVEVDPSSSAMIQTNRDAMWIQGTIRREIVDIEFHGPLEEGCPHTMQLNAKWILTVDQQKIQHIVSYFQEIVPLMHPDKNFEKLETLHEYTVLETLSWHEASYFSYDEKPIRLKDDAIINIQIKNIVTDGKKWMLELDMNSTFNQIKELYKLQPYDVYHWPASVRQGDLSWRLWIGHPNKYKPTQYPHISILHNTQ